MFNSNSSNSTISDVFNFTSYGLTINEMFNSTRSIANIDKANEAISALPQGEALLIQRAGFVPVAVLGIFGNLLALISWHADHSENVATFLFKVLAVWDTIFLSSFSFVVLAQEGVLFGVVLGFAHVTWLAKLSSVHVTLLIGFNRWLAVFRPHHVNVLLTPRRVRVTVVATFVWCVLLQSLDLVWTPREVWRLSDGLDLSVKVAIFFTKQTVGFILPHLLLVVFNVLLIFTVNRNLTAEAQLKEKRRATLLVIWISVCSLIAYPVGIFVQMLLEETFIVNSSSPCDLGCLAIISTVFVLLQAVNASLNVVFYALFSTKFRMLFRHQLSRCLNFLSSCLRLFGRDARNNVAFSSDRSKNTTL